MTHPIERASVEQADRDFAAFWILISLQNAKLVREGKWDHHEGVQATARHRQQARDAGFAEGREALMTTTSHLVAAISLLRKYHDACAPTKRHALFGTMIADYEKAAQTGRAALSAEANEGRCDG